MDTISPGVVVLGGPNGAGKSTTAPRLLRGSLRVSEFVNAKDRDFGEVVRVLRLFPENRISEVVHQARHVLVVLLTDVLGELAVRAPDVVPSDRPRAGVCPRIINRRFVVQRVLIRP